MVGTVTCTSYWFDEKYLNRQHFWDSKTLVVVGVKKPGMKCKRLLWITREVIWFWSAKNGDAQSGKVIYDHCILIFCKTFYVKTRCSFRFLKHFILVGHKNVKTLKYFCLFLCCFLLLSYFSSTYFFLQNLKL